MRRQDWKPTRSSRLCSLHFEDHAFTTDAQGNRRLKSTAVPTVFSLPEHSMRKPTNRRARQRLMVQMEKAQLLLSVRADTPSKDQRVLHKEHPRSFQRENEVQQRGLDKEKTLKRGEEGENVDPEHYLCRICGFHARDVICLSQHLHSTHPITSLQVPGFLRGERCGPMKEERKREMQQMCISGGQSSTETECRESTIKEKLPLEEGSTFSLAECDKQSCRTKDAVESQPAVQPGLTEMDKHGPAPKFTQKPFCNSGIQPKSHDPSSRGPCQDKHTAASCTSSVIQTHLVCLPLVSEGLKLLWVRSEQAQELDAVAKLVEAFNAFPYLTPQEASALARHCSLTPDRVKVWFMMRRIRYGISWEDEDIRETRRKLSRLHGREQAPERLEDGRPRNGDREEQVCPFELNERTVVEKMQQVQTPDVLPPLPSLDEQQDVTNQNCNRVRDTEHQSFQSPMRLPIPPSPMCPVGPSRIRMRTKKSKAQLMDLRRSFVRRHWPSETELQRLQDMTGLSRHEIRQWFADRRYQLRRNGQRCLSGAGRHTRFQPHPYLPLRGVSYDGSLSNSICTSSPGMGSETGCEIEVDVAAEGEKKATVASTDPSMVKEEVLDETPIIQNNSSVNFPKNTSFEPSHSPSSSSTPDVVPPLPPLDKHQDVTNQNCNSVRDTEHQIFQSPIRLPMPPSPLCPVGPSRIRMRTKKSKAQLMTLRRSFVRRHWLSETELQRLQDMTGLSRHEIRQWFADSRYQLRRNGRRCLSGTSRHTRFQPHPHLPLRGVSYDGSLSNSICASSPGMGSETGCEIEVDVAAEGEKKATVALTDPSMVKEEVLDETPIIQNNSSVNFPKNTSFEPSHSPSSSSTPDVVPPLPPLDKHQDVTNQNCNSVRDTEHQIFQSPIRLPMPPSPLCPVGPSRIRMRTKKSKAQLMTLRRSFVRRHWPTEAEVQRLQDMTSLDRHEIRQWFADSRYQLRRNGQRCLSGTSRRTHFQPHPHLPLRGVSFDGSLSNSICASSPGMGSETECEIEVDVAAEGEKKATVASTDPSMVKEEVLDETPIIQSNSSVNFLKNTSFEPSHSPSSSSSPSPSSLLGQSSNLLPEHSFRFHKKSREQLNILRQSFLRCQWPSSAEYSQLQEQTGLTRQQIIQWFGDTRYHVKRYQLRWMDQEERHQIATGIMQSQHGGSRYSRCRSGSENLPSVSRLRTPQFVSGVDAHLSSAGMERDRFGNAETGNGVKPRMRTRHCCTGVHHGKDRVSVEVSSK
ncbi:uncharacterized protein LOC115816617 [Chanos chanos]|uniref:Uncharacterized protein LOC115816617 n=1 Tax=Chanos chanos TaxID=29144 RepID=A0A6J2VWF2_CHACN|nr:uncharacterized protein LOC115816617 [Chanos chanos]